MKGLAIACGPLAQRLAADMECEQETILFDRFGLTTAIVEAMRRKARKHRFLVRALLQSETELRLNAVASQIVAPSRSLEESRDLWVSATDGILQINHTHQLRDVAMYSNTERKLISAILRLGDGYVAATESERHRIVALTGAQLTDFVKLSSIDSLVPQPHEATLETGDSIVVWAPDLPGDCVQAMILPLLDFKTSIRVISATDPSHRGFADFLRIDRTPEVLKRAKVIIDASSYGVDTALALARWRKPLVCDLEIGADECLIGVHTYTRTVMSSLVDAVLSALGAKPPIYRESASAIYPSIEVTATEPLVSILIPTLDRRDLLAMALQSIRSQGYRNIETIVCVDGGPRLDDLAAIFSEVTFIYNSVNDIYATARLLFSASHGRYLNFLNDDDLFFPNHVHSLVAALERKTSSVAHADAITAYLRGGTESGWELYGVDSTLSSSADPTELLVSNRIDMMSCMFRRDLIEDGSPFDPAVPYFGDYSMWLRFLRANDFIHVPRITSCYTVRNRGSQQQSVTWSDRRIPGFEALYRREPVNDRPIIQRRRGELLGTLRAGMGTLPLDPAATVPASAWPPWT